MKRYDIDTGVYDGASGAYEPMVESYGGDYFLAKDVEKIIKETLGFIEDESGNYTEIDGDDIAFAVDLLKEILK